MLGLIGLTGFVVFSGFAGGVGAGTGFGLTGLIPGLTTASRAALRAAIAKSNSIFAAALAAFFLLLWLQQSLLQLCVP